MTVRSVASEEQPVRTVPIQDSPRALPAHGLGDPRILIVDDTRAIHEDFRKVLGERQDSELEDLETAIFDRPSKVGVRARFILDSAYQGEEGLALVQSALTQGFRYALAFVDVRMPPGWDGVETAAKLWGVDPDLQIVICTAYSDFSWDEMVQRLGQSDNLLILKKPFDPTEVVQLAHALTRKWFLVQQSQRHVQDLDRAVAQRTQDLRAANKQLVQEVAERKRAGARLAAFSALGQRLSAAKTAREAAQIIADAADELLGWDACFCDLYAAAEDRMTYVLSMDIIEGRRRECGPKSPGGAPPPLSRRAIRDGAFLLLQDPSGPLASQQPFGDTRRPAASLLFVPIRHGTEVIGVLSIQSYQARAYDDSSLETLQALADHCAGALARIRAQEELSESEEHFRSTWERSSDGMRLTDREGRIISVNEAYCKLVKRSRPELVGQTFSVVYHSHGPNNGIEVYRRRFDTGTIVPRLSSPVRFWNGDEVELEIANSFIGPGRHGKLVLSIFRDVTERKQLEHQLRQSQKMEAIGQLAGGVAHDFNNLLAVIRGNTELLLLSPEQPAETQNECMKQVLAAADRAANLTRQLLAFSRKQVMQSQPLDLNDVIGNFTKMLKRIIGEDIELHCNYGARLPLVRADVGMLEQVLVNLVVNARDAMPKGGRLVIGTERVSFNAVEAKSHSEARPGEFVCLGVSDTGTGIAPEHLPRVFEPFFTTKEVGKGTGLGLATVYGIVKQHDGWAEVASTLGSGATFRIYLPTTGESPAPTSSRARSPDCKAAGGSETLLLVEDDEAVRSLTRRLLESAGYHVIEAESGAQALEIAGEQLGEIDLLLTDMIMPEGVSGRELAERLLAQRPGFKVIFMTGYSGEVAGKDTSFLRRTGSRFLQKPCHWQDLLEAIRASLDNKPLPSAG